MKVGEVGGWPTWMMIRSLDETRLSVVMRRRSKLTLVKSQWPSLIALSSSPLPVPAISVFSNFNSVNRFVSPSFTINDHCVYCNLSSQIRRVNITVKYRLVRIIMFFKDAKKFLQRQNTCWPGLALATPQSVDLRQLQHKTRVWQISAGNVRVQWLKKENEQLAYVPVEYTAPFLLLT